MAFRKNGACTAISKSGVMGLRNRTVGVGSYMCVPPRRLLATVNCALN